jgi:hypothetical protein
MQTKPSVKTSAHQSDSTSESALLSYGSPEVVGVLPTEAEVEAAVDQLLVSGFDRQQISVLADRLNCSEGDNRVSDLPRVSKLEDDPQTHLGAYVSSDSRAEIEAAAIGVPIYAAAIGGYGAVVASGGSLALALAALLMAGAAGGSLGGLLAHTISHRHHNAVAAQLAKGGLLLWVQARSLDQENRAIRVLNAHHGRHVHVHNIERAWGIENVPFHNAQPDPFLERS